jgi:D-lactate dehydrogenase
MKIAVFELEPWEHEAFEPLRDNHELVRTESPLHPDNAADFADADAISTFIYSKLGADTLRTFDDLQLIATRSTGYDHVDARFCREHGITVCNVPSYGAHTVAEHVFALLLALSHHVVEAVDRTRRGDFSMQNLRGFDLLGKTLGVVGTGDIGRGVVEIADGFGMEILAHDVEPTPELIEAFDVEYVSLDELLDRSDVVTLHVPLDEETRHLLSYDEFDRMKAGSILINTARGEIVDTKALLRALGEGRVAAAGLDVLPEEPSIREEAELLRSIFREEHDLETLLADHVLLRMRNVIITPHSAFNTTEAIQRILETTVDNLDAFARGAPQSVVIAGRHPHREEEMRTEGE